MATEREFITKLAEHEQSFQYLDIASRRDLGITLEAGHHIQFLKYPRTDRIIIMVRDGLQQNVLARVNIDGRWQVKLIQYPGFDSHQLFGDAIPEDHPNFDRHGGKVFEITGGTCQDLLINLSKKVKQAVTF